MLSDKKIAEIREFLEKSQNPLFFFDNDVDGLCSFLILQKALGRGKGVAVRSFPDLNENYIKKVNELNPDYVFILDKPKVSSGFIEKVYEKGIPLVWIDHHEVELDESIKEKIYYFNSFPSSEPVTYLSYSVFKKKEDMWLAMIGCIGDVYMPDFACEFAKENPELFNPKLNAFDSLYMTEIGRLVKILNFSLKDTTTNVLNMMKFLYKSKNAYDVLEENEKTRSFHLRYKQLTKIYEKLIEKAEKEVKEKLVFFEYGGEISMSSELANGLYFSHKDKFIVVSYKKQDKANISIRGKNAKKITIRAIKDIEGATGGGHDEACGAQVRVEMLPEFKKKIEDLLEKE